MKKPQQQPFPDNQLRTKRMKRLQINLTVFAVALATGIIWVSFASYRNFEQQLRTKLEQQLVSIASSKSSELSAWYKERYGDAEILINSPALPTLIYDLVHNLSDQDLSATLQRYLESFKAAYGYKSFTVTDASATVILSSSETAELGLVHYHAEDVMKAFETSQVVFLDFYSRAVEDAEIIELSLIVPIFCEGLKRQPLGSVVMTINPENYLYPLITSWPLPHRTAETLLVRPENNHVLYLSPLRFNPDAALNQTVSLSKTEVLTAKAVNGHSGVTEGIDYRGQEVIGAANEVTGTPWFMVAHLDKEEYLAPIQARKKQTVFTTGALLFITFAVFFIIWRGQQLHYLQSVSKINQELEQRVKERTIQLEAVNHELEAFVYSVSHDLRAPLRVVSGFSGVLQTEYGAELDDQGRHYLERITAAANRMGDLIDDLLALSRATRSNLLYKQVDLTAMAAEILTELQTAEPERRVIVKIATGMNVRGDLRLLRLAMENLLSNAWKFSSMNDRAIIEVGCDNKNENTFYVTDNGVGFDMAYADKLYTPFQRLHGNNEFSGTGVGLATVQRIIRRHGGNIWAEGQVGVGATFYFSLPG